MQNGSEEAFDEIRKIVVGNDAQRTQLAMNLFARVIVPAGPSTSAEDVNKLHRSYSLLNELSRSPDETVRQRAKLYKNNVVMRIAALKLQGFEKLMRKGGWGPKVQAKALKPGQSGKQVVQLRNRLIAMGYLKRTSTSSYDDRIRQGVARFQRDHGLVADGNAGRTCPAANAISG